MGGIRVTAQAKTQEGKTLHHRSTTKAEGEQLKIYQALGYHLKSSERTKQFYKFQDVVANRPNFFTIYL
jgi:hypothetical protein